MDNVVRESKIEDKYTNIKNFKIRICLYFILKQITGMRFFYKNLHLKTDMFKRI